MVFRTNRCHWKTGFRTRSTFFFLRTVARHSFRLHHAQKSVETQLESTAPRCRSRESRARQWNRSNSVEKKTVVGLLLMDGGVKGRGGWGWSLGRRHLRQCDVVSGDWRRPARADADFKASRGADAAIWRPDAPTLVRVFEMRPKNRVHRSPISSTGSDEPTFNTPRTSSWSEISFFKKIKPFLYPKIRNKETNEVQSICFVFFMSGWSFWTEIIQDNQKGKYSFKCTAEVVAFVNEWAREVMMSRLRWRHDRRRWTHLGERTSGYVHLEISWPISRYRYPVMDVETQHATNYTAVRQMPIVTYSTANWGERNDPSVFAEIRMHLISMRSTRQDPRIEFLLMSRRSNSNALHGKLLHIFLLLY